MQPKLSIGDTVLWRGGFGTDTPKRVKVVSIQKVERGEKYGDAVNSIQWALVSDFAVIDLDNGHWAYGSQIKPL